MSNDAASALNRLGIATVTPAGGDKWTVANVRKVGVVYLDGHQILIRPKVPISRLFFMMQYAINPEIWREEEIHLGSDRDLLSTMAEAFLRQVSKVRRQGLIQGYESFEDSLPMMRGRLDIAAQIGRRGGLALPAQVLYDEFTIDVPENRLIYLAVHRLLKLPMLNEGTRTALRKLTPAFEGVTLLNSWEPMTNIRYTRLNSRYRPALLLAEMILRNSSVEHVEGRLTASAFLFDMWRIFEDFVTVTLAGNLGSLGGTAKRQATGKFLDSGARVALRPDLIWLYGGQLQAVIDAKYKTPNSTNYPNTDIYQMLAYCVRFGLDTGHLIYAKGEDDAQLHEILGYEATVHCHTVDLNLPPAALLERMTKLASTIAGPYICPQGDKQSANEKKLRL